MITSGIPPPQSWARQVRDRARPERPTAEHNDGKPPEPAFLRSFGVNKPGSSARAESAFGAVSSGCSRTAGLTHCDSYRLPGMLLRPRGWNRQAELRGSWCISVACSSSVPVSSKDRWTVSSWQGDRQLRGGDRWL
jgi:hypothetical protein